MLSWLSSLHCIVFLYADIALRLEEFVFMHLFHVMVTFIFILFNSCSIIFNSFLILSFYCISILLNPFRLNKFHFSCLPNSFQIALFQSPNLWTRKKRLKNHHFNLVSESICCKFLCLVPHIRVCLIMITSFLRLYLSSWYINV